MAQNFAIGNNSWVLLSTITASSTATIDFTALTNFYSVYKIIITDLVTATNAVALWLRVGTGGTPTYQTGTVYNHVRWTFFLSTGTTTGSGAFGVAADNQIVIQGGNVANTSPASLNGEITIFNPSQSANYHAMKSEIILRTSDATPNTYMSTCFGEYLSTTAVTAIRLMMSSGNITSGNFKIYGIV